MIKEYIVTFETLGGFHHSSQGTMLVEAETIEEAEEKAKEQIIEDSGFATITSFDIELKQ